MIALTTVTKPLFPWILHVYTCHTSQNLLQLSKSTFISYQSLLWQRQGHQEGSIKNSKMSKIPRGPILILGAGVSGLLLAQYLRKTGVPFVVFERDADLATRGLGWGLTIHWSLPALRSLLPAELVARLPEAYVDREAVEQGRASTFPFFDLSSGALVAATPKAGDDARIRVARDRFRRLLAAGIDIQVCPPG
jgi:hypothetical protein